jgi:hypothetical protein
MTEPVLSYGVFDDARALALCTIRPHRWQMLSSPCWLLETRWTCGRTKSAKKHFQCRVSSFAQHQCCKWPNSVLLTRLSVCLHSCFSLHHNRKMLGFDVSWHGDLACHWHVACFICIFVVARSSHDSESSQQSPAGIWLSAWSINFRFGQACYLSMCFKVTNDLLYLFRSSCFAALRCFLSPFKKV